MALTNFAALTDEQLTVWSRQFWQEARNKSFLMSFMGSNPNSMIQRVTELRKTTDGARAVITLVSDSTGDGVVGDNEMEGNEEALKSSDQVIQLDQMGHSHRSKGRMAEQASVVQFRGEAKDKLSYWLADRWDQLAFLTLSGVSYAMTNNGASRVGSQFPMLSFANDVTAPSANRYFRWDGTNKVLATGNTSSVAATDTPSWEMLVNLKAAAVNSYIRPIRTVSGIETYNVFMSPDGIAKLKLDDNFLQAWRLAQKRGETNPLFKGTPIGGREGIYIDGLNILEYRHVYNTKGAASGSKWGSGGTVNGQRVLLCGAQALAAADIGMATWDEKVFNYGNSPGIAVRKIGGLLKPKFFSIYSQSTEDFSVIACDTAI